MSLYFAFAHLIKSTDAFAVSISVQVPEISPASISVISIHFSWETSASRAVLVADAAGKNTLATTPHQIKLQICLFLAAVFKIVGSHWLRLQGLWDISKHLLSIYFESYSQSDVSFNLSVTCHRRNPFIDKVTKEQLEAKNPQSPQGLC